MTDATTCRRRILAVSPVSSYCGFNTSVHRIEALKALDFEVEVIDSAELSGSLNYQRRLRRLSHWLFRRGLPIPTYTGSQLPSAIREIANAQQWDILWLEKSLDVTARVIEQVRRANPAIAVIGFSPDDMAGRHNQSKQFLSALPHYDAFLTTKTYNVAELQEMGAKRAVFIGNGFDPEAFHPEKPTTTEREELGADVGFIGSWEQDRATKIAAVARSGFNVKVWGFKWDQCEYRHPNLALKCRPLLFDRFRKACASFKINLNFLRKLNRDQQTTRSVEIPACGGFMLSERTGEHLELFREGVEAEFFASEEELLDKCRFYLARDDLRRRIARAGRERCLRSGYTNAERLNAAFSELGFTCVPR